VYIVGGCRPRFFALLRMTGERMKRRKTRDRGMIRLSVAIVHRPSVAVVRRDGVLVDMALPGCDIIALHPSIMKPYNPMRPVHNTLVMGRKEKGNAGFMVEPFHEAEK
jgi:hypothetical protein